MAPSHVEEFVSDAVFKYQQQGSVLSYAAVAVFAKRVDDTKVFLFCSHYCWMSIDLKAGWYTLKMSCFLTEHVLNRDISPQKLLMDIEIGQQN